MVIPVLSLIEVAKDATSITLKDATGAYNGTTNLGGYGTPNAAVPTVIGMRTRYWPDDDIYGGFISDSAGLIAALMSTTGYAITGADLGLTDDEFTSGIHHFKYYPLEVFSTQVTLTLDSKLVTVTGGTAPDTWNAGYKGIMFWDGITLGTKVYLIDYTQPITSTTFYITEAWPAATVTDYDVQLAPEADLKVLVKELANECLVARIGKLGTGCGCNKDEIDILMRLTMWLFAAQVNAECADYQGAHNKVVAVDSECNDCKQTCSCS